MPVPCADPSGKAISLRQAATFARPTCLAPQAPTLSPWDSWPCFTINPITRPSFGTALPARAWLSAPCRTGISGQERLWIAAEPRPQESTDFPCRHHKGRTPPDESINHPYRVYQRGKCAFWTTRIKQAMMLLHHRYICKSSLASIVSKQGTNAISITLSMPSDISGVWCRLR